MVTRLDAITCEKFSSGHWALAFGLELENLHMPFAGGHAKFLAVRRNHNARQCVGRSTRGTRPEQNQPPTPPERVGMRPGVETANQVVHVNR
jgi:hypothetical protein